MNRQDSLLDQLDDLHTFAVRYGMYDAAQWLEDRFERNRVVASLLVREGPLSKSRAKASNE